MDEVKQLSNDRRFIYRLTGPLAYRAKYAVNFWKTFMKTFEYPESVLKPDNWSYKERHWRAPTMDHWRKAAAQKRIKDAQGAGWRQGLD